MSTMAMDTVTMSRTGPQGTSSPVRGTDAAPRVRLTRRGRVAVVVVAAVLLLAAFSLGRVASSAAPSAETTQPVHSVVVQPGDTLWSVAQQLAPDHDPRGVVEQIRRLNDLDRSTLHVGQQLLLPSAA